MGNAIRAIRPAILNGGVDALKKHLRSRAQIDDGDVFVGGGGGGGNISNGGGNTSGGNASGGNANNGGGDGGYGNSANPPSGASSYSVVAPYSVDNVNSTGGNSARSASGGGSLAGNARGRGNSGGSVGGTMPAHLRFEDDIDFEELERIRLKKKRESENSAITAAVAGNAGNNTQSGSNAHNNAQSSAYGAHGANVHSAGTSDYSNSNNNYNANINYNSNSYNSNNNFSNSYSNGPNDVDASSRYDFCERQTDTGLVKITGQGNPNYFAPLKEMLIVERGEGILGSNTNNNNNDGGFGSANSGFGSATGGGEGGFSSGGQGGFEGDETYSTTPSGLPPTRKLVISKSVLSADELFSGGGGNAADPYANNSSTLKSFAELESVACKDCQIPNNILRSISYNGGFTHLRNLSITQSKLTEIQWIELPHLISLDLCRNQLVEIPFLANCPVLHEIRVAQNRLVKLKCRSSAGGTGNGNTSDWNSWNEWSGGINTNSSGENRNSDSNWNGTSHGTNSSQNLLFPSSLTTLDVSDNQITEIENGADFLKISANFHSLLLQNNSLRELPAVWGTWTGLRNLSLEGNLLRRYGDLRNVEGVKRKLKNAM